MFAPARFVDDALRVLDAKADGEGLGLNVHTACMQHFKGVARTVTEGQHNMLCWQLVTFVFCHVQHSDGL